MSTVLAGLSCGRWQLEPETPHIRYVLLRMLRFKSSELTNLFQGELPVIDIESLTLKEIREIAKLTGTSQGEHPWQIGKVYLIRTVTMIQTGRLIRVTPQELVLEDACWIADTGRFSDALKSLEFAETEPFPDGPVIVGRGSVIDAVVVGQVQRSQR
jgi:hypothetical protein